ncbi:MAG: response regulator [bacterium]|nr:response regulator [bacterium]
MQSADGELPSILAIDDNPANLRLLADMLGSAGFDVRVTLNGEAGLSAAQRLPPDLVLLDINMPEHDGYEVCRQFKAHRHLSNIPIMFISAADETLDKVKAFAAGGVDYIVRPFHVDEVLARINTQIKLYRAYLQAEELAILRERERLARELHDAVNQMLFSINLAAETTLRQHEQHPEKTPEHLREIQALAHEALVEMRVLMYELRPETLVGTRLDELLSALVHTLTTNTRLKIVIDLDSPNQIAPEVQFAFYRIAQEALTNIVRHAKARHALIQLVDDDRLRLLISDDGQDFDPHQSRPGHFGLANIRSRAVSVGAHCTITSEAGRGTTVEIELDKGQVDDQ